MVIKYHFLAELPIYLQVMDMFCLISENKEEIYFCWSLLGVFLEISIFILQSKTDFVKLNFRLELQNERHYPKQHLLLFMQINAIILLSQTLFVRII